MNLTQNDPAVLDKLEEEITKNIPAYFGDKLVYRMVVFSLGAVALIAITGALLLVALTDEDVPELVTALGSAAIGAIAGLLVPSPSQ